jgi:hypothetical protein
MLMVRAALARQTGNFDAAREAAARAYANSDNPVLKFDAAVTVADVYAREEKFLRSQLWLRRADQIATTEQQEELITAAFRRVNRLNPLTIQLRFSVNPSNNVNNGADNLEVEIGGLPFRLSADGQALGGVEATLGFSMSYRLSENAEQRTDALFDLFYRNVWLDSSAKEVAPDAKGSDFDYGSVVVGIRQQRLIWPETGASSFTGTVGQSWYGGDKLARWVNVGARQEVRLDEDRSLIFGAGLRDEKRLDDSINDSKSLLLSADFRQAVEGVGGFELGMTLRNFLAGSYGFGVTMRDFRSDSATVDRTSVELRAFRSFGQIGMLQPSVTFSVENRNYHKFTSVEGGRRDRSVSLGLRTTVPDARLYGFIPEATLRVRRTYSTVDIYDRDELTFGVTAISRF